MFTVVLFLISSIDWRWLPLLAMRCGFFKSLLWVVVPSSTFSNSLRSSAHLIASHTFFLFLLCSDAITPGFHSVALSCPSFAGMLDKSQPLSGPRLSRSTFPILHLVL